MPSGAFLTLLDDMVVMAKKAAVTLDDIGIQTAMASKKAAGIVVDDMAVSAGSMVEFDPKRELPIVWAVAKGSAVNKAIIIPAALALSAFAPWSIGPLLMAGGAFLCYEGVHKIRHSDEHKDEPHLIPEKADPVTFEKEKIKGAVQTDMILSAEIMAMTLASVAAAPLVTQLGTLAAVGALMTVGVYGVVAGLVKMDDAGLALSRSENKASQKLGRGILKAAPGLFKAIAVIGTGAMLAVGGGILAHAVPPLAHLAESAGALKGIAELGIGLGVGGVAGCALTSKPAEALFDAAKPVLAGAFKPIAALVKGVKAGLKRTPDPDPKVDPVPGQPASTSLAGGEPGCSSYA